MLTLMREMSVTCVSVLSNLTSSLTRPVSLPTEMNLDNTTTHHLPRVNPSNLSSKPKGQAPEASKTSRWMIALQAGSA